MPSLQAALIQCKVILINEKKHLKIWAVAILFIYWFIYAVNMSTYAWQTTTLSPFFPSVRDSCPMTYPDGKHCNIISTTSMLPKLNIAIVCLYGDPNKNKRSNNLWNQALYDRIFENRNAYAKRYGYTIIKTPFELIDKSRPIAWSKLLAINKYLPDYDYVFYLDMDTVILNMDVSLESIIGMGCKGSSRSSSSSSSSSSVANSDSKSTGSNGGIISKATRDDDYDRHHRFSFYSYKHVKPTSGIHTIRSNSHTQSYLVSDADIILTTDHNGPNTGSFLIRNSEFSQWLMNETFAQSQLVPKTQTTHGLTRSHPFEYEQRAFHYILDTKIWANRQLPSYPGNISEIREHFRYVPQCTMNSYSLHPFYLTNSKIDRKSEQYIDTDFIIHFAGVKGVNKVNMMEYYLNVAKTKYHY